MKPGFLHLMVNCKVCSSLSPLSEYLFHDFHRNLANPLIKFSLSAQSPNSPFIFVIIPSLPI